MVTFGWLEDLPMVIDTGKALPGVTVCGIRAFTCKTPAGSEGASLLPAADRIAGQSEVA